MICPIHKKPMCSMDSAEGLPDESCAGKQYTNCWDCVCARLKELEAENDRLRAATAEPSTADRIALAIRQLDAQKN